MNAVVSIATGLAGRVMRQHQPILADVLHEGTEALEKIAADPDRAEGFVSER